VRVGLVQMASTERVEENLSKVENWLSRAKEENCLLVALPEVFNCFTHDDLKLELCESVEESPSLEFCKEQARKNGFYLLAGSINLKLSDQERVVNRSHFIGPDGSVLCHYDKIHLFDVTLSDGREYRESRLTCPGEEVVSHSCDFGVVGLSVCYDLRFPELYRQLGKVGSQMFFVPSAFTRKTGKAHWKMLLQARAVENQAFVIAPNQCGVHERGMETYGNSLILDPWGEVLVQAPEEEEGLFTAELDLASQKSLQERMPVLNHRRLS